MHGVLLAVRAVDDRLHGSRVLGSEVENMADLDPAGGNLGVGGNSLERRRIVFVGRGGVERGPLVDDPLHRLHAAEVDVLGRRLEREIVAMAEHFALAGRRQNDEFVAEVAADRARLRPHRNSGQAKPRESAQVSGELLIVGMARADLVEVERIGVLHQELARAHHAEAGPDLVAELPLDMIEIERQILVGAHRGAEDLGDHLLVGGPVQHVAVVPVADAQHLLAVVVVASGFAPEISRLNGRHQDLDRAGAVLLLADDGADLVQDPDAERQPGVAARRLLPDHAGAQHQPMRDDFRLFRRLLQNGEEVTGKTHGSGLRGDANRAGSVTLPAGPALWPQRSGGASRAMPAQCPSRVSSLTGWRAILRIPTRLPLPSTGEGAHEPQSWTNPILPSAPFFQTYQT